VNKVSIGQVVLGVLWPALVTVEKLVLAAGPLQDSVVAATNSVFGVLIIMFRVPSTSGGTIAPAAQIVPNQPTGTALVAAPPVK
jgi:hypothetical protein